MIGYGKALIERYKLNENEKDLKDAEKSLKEAYDISKEITGEYHLETANAREGLSKLAMIQNNSHEALKHFKHAVAINYKIFGISKKFAKGLKDLSLIYLSQEEDDLAIECTKMSENINEELAGLNILSDFKDINVKVDIGKNEEKTDISKSIIELFKKLNIDLLRKNIQNQHIKEDAQFNQKGNIFRSNSLGNLSFREKEDLKNKNAENLGKGVGQ